ncbi:MAG: lysophospholipid acyltransferase family protein [Acidimicrobiales bacterium]
MAYWILKALLSPFLFLFWRVRVEGSRHVPSRGPAVLAANHQSFCDSFFLPLVLRRRVTYVAKAEYFDSWKTAWFFRASGQIPMRREGGGASQRALDTATDVLNAGQLLAIYPEGTRPADLRLHKGHTGAARLSLRCGVPIIPVGIVGTREIQPPGINLMRPFLPVTIRFGPPVTYLHAGQTLVTGRCGPRTPGRWERADRPGRPGQANADTAAADTAAADTAAEQEELRAITDALMEHIALLSGQDYVDAYAKRREPDRS